MLSVKVGGVWLSTVAAYGPVTVEFGRHGSEAASWEMSPAVRHQVLRGNSLVEIFDGGFCIWAGTLVEPDSDGLYSARGLWHQAEATPAMASDGSLTTVIDFALNGAGPAFRGEIGFYTPVSISGTPWASSSGELTLAALLDGYADENGLRWIVTPDSRMVVMRADPTVPSWYVPHAVSGRGLTPAEDEFATHLVGTYYSATNVRATVTVGSSEAATAFGRRTAPVDLTPMGVITGTRATSVLTGMFLLSGARMGWGEGLELSAGQITISDGSPAALSQVQALQMIRLAGTIDTSRANRLSAYTDIVIGSSRYTDGSNSISLTPIGYAPRTLSDILTIAVEGDAP